ncbi:alpha/beta fold hydrolase, partial [Rubrimonas sp.]|uniref:alpha/beta fold hydrolase n=1 Tax=Rubrimonas sp. TaxID=2036015 RepID=UPI003FA6ACC4
MQADLDGWLTRAENDGVLADACRGLDLVLELRAGVAMAALRLQSPPSRTDPGATSDILIEGDAAAFGQIMQALPPPGMHSFGAVIRHAVGIKVTADPLKQALALAALERLFELARPGIGDPDGFTFPHDPGAVRGLRRELVCGRGRTALIHWLEAGEGTPLVFLHTAGADSRQFLHQLADTELRSRFRMMAFDLPWHGASTGEDGDEAAAGYVLTEA